MRQAVLWISRRVLTRPENFAPTHSSGGALRVYRSSVTVQWTLGETRWWASDCPKLLTRGGPFAAPYGHL